MKSCQSSVRGSTMSNEEQKTQVGTAFESAVARMQQVGHAAAAEAKGLVAETQDSITSVASKMRQSATAEVKAAASDLQAGIAKARKVVRAESGAVKARMKLIRRAAGSRTKGVLAGAQAKVAEVRKAVRGAVQKAVGKKAKVTGAPLRKPTARIKKSLAAKAGSRKQRPPKAAARAGARKIARKTKR